MILGLKIALIVYGVLGILDGLALIIAPQLFASMWGFGGIGEMSDFGVNIAAVCGTSFMAACVWIIAAARDPLRHILWVKFVIFWSILVVVVQLYSVAKGAIDFNQAVMGIIGGAILAVAFLILYPYRATRAGQ